MNRFLVFILLLASCAFAEQPWPKQTAEAKFTATRTDTLPKALVDALLEFDEFTQGGEKLPEMLYICRIDLNSNGNDEFIVQSNQSYSGGPMMYVFERRKNKFVNIADLGGGIYFAPPVNGYLEIVAHGRAGGGSITKSLYRYDRGSYHLVRIADYRHRETGNALDFVRERNPKEYDH